MRLTESAMRSEWSEIMRPGSVVPCMSHRTSIEWKWVYRIEHFKNIFGQWVTYAHEDYDPYIRNPDALA